MCVLWDQGQATADEIRRGLRRRLKDATVRTVLRRLELKGYVTHEIDGRTFSYRAAHPREAVVGGVIRQFAASFFGNSMSALLVGLVDANALTEAEVEAAQRRLEQAQLAREGGK